MKTVFVEKSGSMHIAMRVDPRTRRPRSMYMSGLLCDCNLPRSWGVGFRLRECTNRTFSEFVCEGSDNLASTMFQNGDESFVSPAATADTSKQIVQLLILILCVAGKPRSQAYFDNCCTVFQRLV